MRAFRERLNQLFAESGKTVKDFASEVVHASRQSVGYYLNGDRVPDSETLAQICKNCHVSADWLLGLSDIRSTDHDIKSACETLRISEASAENLISTDGKIDSLLSESSLILRVSSLYTQFLECSQLADNDAPILKEPVNIPKGFLLVSPGYQAVQLAHSIGLSFERFLLEQLEKGGR